MSVKSHGQPSAERDKVYTTYEHQSAEGTGREYSGRPENISKKSELNGNKIKQVTIVSQDENSKRIKSGVRLRSDFDEREVAKLSSSKSHSVDYKSAQTPRVRREQTEPVDSDPKTKRRFLVKQPTHGKFELKDRGSVNPDVRINVTGKKSPDSIPLTLEQKEASAHSIKRRILPSTPFSVFHRKGFADESLNEKSKNVHGLVRNPESASYYPPVGTKQTANDGRHSESNLLLEKSLVTKVNRGQTLPSVRSVTRPVDPEFIPLQSLQSKQLTSQSGLSSKEYEKRYRERIRLRDRTVSSDDSAFIEHQKVNPGRIKSDFNDGKKTVAFCTVHSSGSFDIADVSSVPASSLKPVESQFISPQKQYLSPENCAPMLEKSKSLQRLANQSSTETSGLGETVTSGFSSQESLVSYYSGARAGCNTDQVTSQQDQGIDLREDTRNIHHEGNSSFGTRIIDSDNIINHTNELKKSNRGTRCVESIDTSGVDISVLDTDAAQSEKSHGASGKVRPGDGSLISRDMTNKHTMGQTDHLSVRGYKPPLDFRSNDVKKPENLPVFSSNVGPDFDTLFTQSRNLKVPPAAVGIQIDQINNEWEKHNRSASIKSRSSQGSFRSRSGSTRRSRRFLGERESMWMKWGRERRLSFRKRMEQLEKPPEPEVPRASTPVKKARQEGLMFIHPDLGSKYISEDDINYIKRHKQERLKTCKLIEKSKTKLHHEGHHLNRLTADELMTLSRFWEHRVFVRSRYVSILLSLVTTVIYVLSICSTQWVTYPSPGVMDHYAHEGLWFKCQPVLRNKHYTESCEDPTGRSKSNC